MSTASLQIRLLGELAVLRQGEPVRLPRSKKTRALLAYLVLRPGPHRRERLCEIFWQIPDDPRAALRWSLSKLRRVVNDDAHERIRGDREHVEFVSEDGEIDMEELASTVDNGMDTMSTDALCALADRRRGMLMTGLDLDGQPEFESFRLAQQEQARVLRARLLREIAERLRDTPSERADRLAQLVRIEPFDFDLHCDLVAALAQAGRMRQARHQQALSTKTFADVEGIEFARLERALEADPVADGATDEVDIPSDPSWHQDIRFCTTVDGLQIAYASVGQGPPVVKTSNWLNHLEFDWESPVWAHVFRALADGRTLIRYDARGNGLSDWHVDDFSIEAQVGDLEAVIDAVGLDRFPLLGISQGCAVSAAYAARHPERVTRLVLLGGYARGWRKARSKDKILENEAMMVLMKKGWGKDNPAYRQMFSSLFMPNAPPENHIWFNDLQRMTTSAENAVRLYSDLGDIDIRALLPSVRAPALVLHARRDTRVPFNAGRELAAGLPDARFVALETSNHLMPDNDPAWPRFVAELDAFLSEAS